MPASPATRDGRLPAGLHAPSPREEAKAPPHDLDLALRLELGLESQDDPQLLRRQGDARLGIRSHTKSIPESCPVSTPSATAVGVRADPAPRIGPSPLDKGRPGSDTWRPATPGRLGE